MKTSSLYYPNKDVFRNARIGSMDQYWHLYNRALNDYERFWGDYALEKIDWFKPFDKVLDESDKPFVKWFLGGELNVSYQCIDRHLEKQKNKAAIIFVGDRGEQVTVTYQELYRQVNRFANILKEDLGVQKGDRVVIYMPMILEAAYATLACARIGAIHSIVFGGFSAEALKDRILDAQAKVVITADGAFRKSKPYMLKPIVDKALKDHDTSVEKVLVVERNGEEIEWVEGRDLSYQALVLTKSSVCEPEVMQSEDPLFLLYTSGSTGKPKGVQHTQAGYILWAQMTMEWVFDIQPNDTFWCTADIGWITGHTYILYGPLSAGATTVIFEGVITYPDAGRPWQIVEALGVNQFYTAPTAIRVLHKTGEHEPLKYNLTSLRVLGTVGEPIDPAAWKWYYDVVGQQRCSIVDTYWQTETGGHIVSPLPGATPIKPASATLPLPGIMAEILDPQTGERVGIGESGYLCITKPWPSQIRTVWGDPDRYLQSYYGEVKKNGEVVYFTGDGAMYDENGYIVVTGRTDDVINVSGHRLGTAEIESAIKKYDNVAAVAVVGRPHDIKGESIFAYVVLKSDADKDAEISNINNTIKDEIGNIALCDKIIFVPDLPKTRSGKVMRRLLRALAKGEKITQDVSTLEDPKIIEKIAEILGENDT